MYLIDIIKDIDKFVSDYLGYIYEVSYLFMLLNIFIEFILMV